MELKNIKPIGSPDYQTRTRGEIIQYSLDGKPIAVFKNASVAAKELGVKQSSSSAFIKCADKLIKQSYGFQWRWKEEVERENND